MFALGHVLLQNKRERKRESEGRLSLYTARDAVHEISIVYIDLERRAPPVTCHMKQK
jgi:hypothetical protein